MTFWLVRHAQPLVAAGICYGALDMAADGPATEDCAGQLANMLPAGIALRASPLKRCAQLAGALLKLRPDLNCVTDKRLQEMHFGAWEGQAWGDIAKHEFDTWTADFGQAAAGSSGENVNSFMARVASAIDEVAGTPDTLWITHAGVIRAAQLIASGTREISRADEWPKAAPAFGQWCKLDLQTLHPH